MSDFDISNIQDEGQVEITDLDPQVDGSSASVAIALLEFARKIPFLRNIRTKNTTMALLICVFVLLFMVQPDVSSIQALRTQVPAQSSYLLVQSPLLIVTGSQVKQVTWIKIINGVAIVRQAPPGIIVWHHCKLLIRRFPRKYQRPTIFICR